MTSAHTPDQNTEILTSEEVAALFRVKVRTVQSWADKGQINHFRTPGGTLRFPAAAVHAFRKPADADDETETAPAGAV